MLTLIITTDIDYWSLILTKCCPILEGWLGQLLWLHETYCYVFYYHNKCSNKSLHLNIFITAAPDFSINFSWCFFLSWSVARIVFSHFGLLGMCDWIEKQYLEKAIWSLRQDHGNGNVIVKMHILVPVTVLDLKAYDATTGTPTMKWHELSQNQNKHGRSKY